MSITPHLQFRVGHAARDDPSDVRPRGTRIDQKFIFSEAPELSDRGERYRLQRAVGGESVHVVEGDTERGGAQRNANSMEQQRQLVVW